MESSAALAEYRVAAMAQAIVRVQSIRVVPFISDFLFLFSVRIPRPVRAGRAPPSGPQDSRLPNILWLLSPRAGPRLPGSALHVCALRRRFGAQCGLEFFFVLVREGGLED